MSIEREFVFTYAALKNWNYNFSALKDLTVSLMSCSVAFEVRLFTVGKEEADHISYRKLNALLYCKHLHISMYHIDGKITNIYQLKNLKKYKCFCI